MQTAYRYASNSLMDRFNTTEYRVVQWSQYLYLAISKLFVSVPIWIKLETGSV